MAILRRPPLRRALVIGCTLQSGLHLCGAMAVNFYSAIIVIMSGVQDQTLAIWITAGINVVKIPIALIGVYYVDRIGRRLLLLSSAFGLVIALSLLGLSFMLIAVQSPPAIIIENGTHPDSSCQNLRCDACSYKAECGFCFNRGMEWTSGSCVHIGDKTRWAEYGRCSHNLSSHVTDAQAVWNYGFCPSNFSWLPVVCLLLFFCAFNPGMAPMPQTITAEMFPTWARSTGCSISVTVSYTCNLLVNLTFLTIIRTLTRQGAFLLYAGITFFLFVWYYFVVPETKDQSIEHVQDLLKGSWFSRGRRQKVSFTQKNIESAQKSKQRKGVMYKPAGE